MVFTSEALLPHTGRVGNLETMTEKEVEYCSACFFYFVIFYFCIFLLCTVYYYV